MDIQELKDTMTAGITDAKIWVDGDGHHFQAIVISDLFTGQSRVQRQQTVYSVIGARISSGELHAISLKTYTHDEWAALAEKPVNI